ncbi:MAG: 6-pyruvoyl trahydropterin synthase family protein [Thermoguttaceae bacterium]
MFTITREFTFCYGHRLLQHRGKCAHLHGHNGRVLITLASNNLDQQGMVQDFSDLRSMVGDWIEQTLDHQMLLGVGDPLIPVLREQGEPVYVLEGNPTAENLAKLIFRYLQSHNLPVCSVRFWETNNCSAEYTEE